jgi:hypothetical protein
LLHINSERKKDPSKWSLFTSDALRDMLSHVKIQYEYDTNIYCCVEYLKYDKELTTCVPSISIKRRTYEHLLDYTFLISDKSPFFYFINQLMNLECSCFIKQCMDEINHIILEHFKNINNLNISDDDVVNLLSSCDIPFIGITPDINHFNDVKRISNSNYSVELITRIYTSYVYSENKIAYVGVITDINNNKKHYFYMVQKNIEQIISNLNWSLNNQHYGIDFGSLFNILHNINMCIYIHS